jgi:hypothetical protein
VAKHPFTKREEERAVTRRALIKWTVAAGAALGVSRAKVFDILEGTAGREVAEAASDHATARSLHLVAGRGGLAWFSLLWPQVEVAMAGNNTFAWHKPGMAALMAGTDKPFVRGPDTPFANLPAERQMTLFTCGSNEQHVVQPVSTSELNGQNIFSIASALQSTTSAVLPLVTITTGQTPLTATGATGGADPARIDSADGIIGLFNSAASRAGGLLAKTTDAAMYRAHYDALIQVNRAANRSTTRTAYTTAQGAAKFLGTNLSAKLAVTPADLTRYGVDAGTRANVAQIARTFIIAVKAFKMGLTNSIVLPAMNDDPHEAFSSGDVNSIPARLKLVFDGLMTDLTTTIDENTMKPLSEDTVLTICGDTTKNPLIRSAWPDSSPQNTNTVYVWSGGHLKTGWFGQVKANGTAEGFDANGNAAAYNGANTARFAMASIAYAIAKRDERAIAGFANGIKISEKFGNPKLV